MNSIHKKVGLFLLLALPFVFAGVASRGGESSRKDSPPAGARWPTAIVSMAPSITEILFVVGAGDKVVGVTDFCDYPAAAKNLPKVGGYFDPNYEAVLAMKPDLVILLDNQDSASIRLGRLGIKTLLVKNESITDIIDSIRQIGFAVGKKEAGDKLADEMTAKIKAIKKRSVGLRKPKILMSVAREYGSGGISRIQVAGPKSIYDDLLKKAGGQNVYQGAPVRYPLLSGEAVMRLKPEYVIELVPGGEGKPMMRSLLVNDWSRFIKSGHIERKNIYVITDRYAVRPGPRMIRLLDRLNKIIHPATR